MSRHNCEKEFLIALPRIERHAQISFRSTRCHCTREDQIAEVIALAWKWWRRLRRRGKNPNRFVAMIATFAVRSVRSGRRLVRSASALCPLSPVCQQRHQVRVQTIPCHSSLRGGPLWEALRDIPSCDPAEQAAFRLDFPAWLASFDLRHREIILLLAAGEHTRDVAAHLGRSQGRVSQLRAEYQASWLAFSA